MHGISFSIDLSTVLAVFGPPSTTTITTGIYFCISASSLALNSISPPNTFN